MATIRKAPPLRLSTSADGQAQTAEAPLLIPLAELDDNPYQPRLTYDEAAILEIAASIAAHGLMQVPVGRRMPDGRVQLAFGHRRRRGFDHLAASDPARWGRMPVWLRDLDDEAMARQAWAENRDRKDISAYEEAKAIARYADEFGWSQKQVAEKLGLDRSTVANKVRLLRLPLIVLDQLQTGEISERQAAALLPLTELDEEARARSMNYFYIDNKHVPTANALFGHAATIDSGKLREAVERILNNLTTSLAKKPWVDVALVGPDIVSATCKECPLRLKASNRCPQQACVQARTVAHRAQAAAAASAATGLPATGHTGYGERDTLDGIKLAALQQVATEKKCGRLSVVYDPDMRSPTHPVEGHPHCAIVCGHGQGKRCGCRQTLTNRADPATGRDAHKKFERRRIEEEVTPPATQALAAALANPSAGLWRWIFERLHWTAERKLPMVADRTTVLNALAAAIIAGMTESSTEARYAEQSILTFFKGIGLPSPFEPLAPNPASDPIGALRNHLAMARELAGIGMAHWELGEARKAYDRLVATAPPATLDALIREIDQVAAEIAAAEADPDVCAQTPIPTFLDLVLQTDTLEAKWETRPPLAAEARTIELIAAHLEDLADDEGIDDAAYEALQVRLDTMADRIAQQAKP